MSEATIDALRHRVERLERDRHRLRQLGGLGLVVLAAASLMGQAPAPASPQGGDVIEARELVVRDAAGRPRATLGLAPDGTLLLVLRDAEERLRLRLGVASDGSPALNLFDREGRLRLDMAVEAGGSAVVVLRDGDQQRRVELAAATDGRAAMSLRQKEGDDKPRAGLSIAPGRLASH